ncbi:secondary thiamine-phosphate synthase enzyme YjbQ [Desulfogranum japonicum]|uniref:secondary thiamine-phosphate synthase enzyme YjbQ n=1 Tax=Desulfogranum japonicum TaxID=231447 RepID=UPI00048E8971|nr:secondary thiamine-phosphate synthase enzyme YjbQ [Desulfogranum japonicum]
MLSGELSVTTRSHMEMIDVTAEIAAIVQHNRIHSGLCTVFNPHTTAGITINEGADPDVQKDLVGVFQQMVPRDYPYRHREGNSPSHMMATLTGSSVNVCIENGSLKLGTWQRIFFCEYDGPRSRKLWWQILTA